MKIPVNQTQVKKWLANGMKSYTIEKRFGIPRSTTEAIAAGQDKPFYLKRIKTEKDGMCTCCGFRERHPGFRKLCRVCHRENQGRVGDDENKSWA